MDTLAATFCQSIRESHSYCAIHGHCGRGEVAVVEGGWLSGGWMDVMECGCGGGWVTVGSRGGGWG